MAGSSNQPRPQQRTPSSPARLWMLLVWLLWLLWLLQLLLLMCCADLWSSSGHARDIKVGCCCSGLLLLLLLMMLLLQLPLRLLLLEANLFSLCLCLCKCLCLSPPLLLNFASALEYFSASASTCLMPQ